MIILEIPQNPTVTYAVIVIGTVVVTKLFDYVLKKSDNSSKVEIAKLNVTEQELQELKENLKSALEKVKKLHGDLAVKDQQLAKIKGDWKAVKFAFQILFKGYEKIFKDDEDSLSMLSEMAEILNKEIE